MKVKKQDDGWWIVGVPPYTVDGETYDACGPYPNKEAALEDLRGLESFYGQHPEYTTTPPLLEAGEVEERKYSAHWFVKSLTFRPSGRRRSRGLKSSPGQMTLPGMETEPEHTEPQNIEKD